MKIRHYGLLENRNRSIKLKLCKQHKHNKCIINQMEIGKNSLSYKNALRAILREDPDVILVGEIRDSIDL